MTIKLSSELQIPALEYASQGNAVLGIRDSGKSYTSMLIAEQLMEAKIPFVAFDPIGIWRYLKVGKNGPGYPVVVAGGDDELSDISLTVESAPNIVRAAMKENICLVLDLYSMRLSKADWKRIVQQSVELLLYENKTCGLRHLFIEEAAEFCPQRVGPDQARVYAEIEKLARMGGNASLGYTLINQRAEEVNKAVLELCDCLILHRQKGRHSLTALGKWMDVADAANPRDIIKSLPLLKQGECWVWMQGSPSPQRIQVAEKKTVHPDRRNPLKVSKASAVDVTTFVERLKKSLAKEKPPEKKAPPVSMPERKEEKVREAAAIQSPAMAAELEEERSKVARLEAALKGVKEDYSTESRIRRQLEVTIEKLKGALGPQYEALRLVFEGISAVERTSTVDESLYKVWFDNSSLPELSKAILRVVIEMKQVTRKQILLRLGKKEGGHINNCFSKLTSAKLIKRVGENYVLEEIQ